MYRLVLISTLISIAHSSVIHNHDQGHSALYTQLQSQQQEPQQLLTPLKLQYVAPKAFLSSAGLISGQQITPTQTPQLISPTIQSTPVGNPRHLSSNPQLVTSSNSEIIPRNSQQLVNSNLQQIPIQQLEFVPNPRNNQNIQTTQPFLSLLNSQYLTPNSEQSSNVNGRNQQYLSNPQFITSTNVEQVTGRNQQYLSPITPTANPQYITATNEPVISPRNPQIFTTVSPFTSTDNSQLIQTIPQQNTVSNQGIPLVYTIQSPIDNYSGQHYNRLPATNSIIPELQFADPRSNIIIPNAQIASLLNALYQPGYLLMTMPPTSYTAVNYYDDPANNPIQDTNPIQSDSIQTNVDEDHINNSKSNLVQRSSSDDSTIESESEKEVKETENDESFKLSYKDNHVKYSY